MQKAQKAFLTRSGAFALKAGGYGGPRKTSRVSVWWGGDSRQKNQKERRQKTRRK